MQRREFLQLMTASIVTPYTLTTDPLEAGSYKNRTKEIFHAHQLRETRVLMVLFYGPN